MSSRFPALVRAFLSLTFLAALLTGCGTQVPFTAAKKATVRAVAVGKRSQYPARDQVIVHTLGRNLAGAWGGLIGALAVQGAGADDNDALRAALQQQRIDPGLLLANEFEHELRRLNYLRIAPTAADARFEFNLKTVGLIIRHGYASDLSPIIAAEGKLIRRDGTVLWQQTSRMHETSVRHSQEEYAKNPELLRTAMSAAARGLAREFLREMYEQSEGYPPEEAGERAAEARLEQAEMEEDRQRAKAKRARQTR